MSLLNLLDNYTPFVFTIYSNNFLEYFNAMIRIWAMFMSLERHHYDKAPLVWIAMCTYWGIHNPDLYLVLRLFLLMFDEYPVENALSIIRSKTNDSDTVEQLQQNAKASFQAKAAQCTLKSYFTPPSSFTFRQKQLRYLKIKCADILSHIFIKIAQNQGKAEFKGKGKTLGWFCQQSSSQTLLNQKYFLWDIAVNQSQIQKGYVTFQIVLLPMILNGFCLKGALTHSTLLVSEKFNTVHYVKNYYNTKQRAWQSQQRMLSLILGLGTVSKIKKVNQMHQKVKLIQMAHWKILI